jgi:hypothetical protein
MKKFLLRMRCKRNDSGERRCRENRRKCINQDKNEVYDNDGYMFRIFCILDIKSEGEQSKKFFE